ncbi:MAG: hypothetical protein ACI87E_001548 [Mariniblastus sp.]|jgi:hypothetical protein
MNRSPHPFSFFRFDAQTISQRFIRNLICCCLLVLSNGCGARTAESPKVSDSDIRDGKDITFIVAELTAETSVPWTQPIDLVFDDQFPRYDGDLILANPAILALADGGVFRFYIQPGIDREKFRDAFTIDGGKHLVRGDVFKYSNYYPEGFAFTNTTAPPGTDPVAYAKARGDKMDRFKRVMQALRSYHRENGHFPPAIVYGKDGRPWHSWRVLILPFLGYEYLYKEYDQSLPWDDPKNQAIVERIPEPYVIDEYPNPTNFNTIVALITGKDTAFPLEKE